MPGTEEFIQITVGLKTTKYATIENKRELVDAPILQQFQALNFRRIEGSKLFEISHVDGSYIYIPFDSVFFIRAKYPDGRTVSNGF